MAGEGKPGKARVDEGPMPFDTSVAHMSRVYNYWLGGKDNFAARSVRYLAAGAGIRQFLDIGTGIPTANNTHEVAQGITPVARNVYVDNDRCKSGCTHER